MTRHAVELTAADPSTALTAGNGDFAFTADITGMPTFTDFHTPSVSWPPRQDLDAPVVLSTGTFPKDGTWKVAHEASRLGPTEPPSAWLRLLTNL